MRYCCSIVAAAAAAALDEHSREMIAFVGPNRGFAPPETGHGGDIFYFYFYFHRKTLLNLYLLLHGERRYLNIAAKIKGSRAEQSALCGRRSGQQTTGAGLLVELFVCRVATDIVVRNT